jgi:hypothetical protein
MLATAVPWIASAFCYWLASRTLAADLVRGGGTRQARAAA